MKKRIGIVIAAVTLAVVVLLVWNYLYKKSLMIENYKADLYAVMISYPDGEGNYIPCTIVEKEIVDEFYRAIESSKVQSVKHFVEDEIPFTDGPTIILYFTDGSKEREYYEGEFFNDGYKEVLHSDSEVAAQYEYGWRKYNIMDDTMILFSNQELFELMEKYVEQGTQSGEFSKSHKSS